MIIEIVNDHPVGYLNVEEYAAKHYVSPSTIRKKIFERRIETLKIGYQHWIKEEFPYPKEEKRGPKIKKEEQP